MDIKLLTDSINLAPAKQELTLPQTGELQIALQGKKISFCEEIEIRQALRYVMIKVGLRAQNWPVQVERQLLLNHVKEHYPNHTPAEIRLAFEMALDGKLNVDATCYENFSCLYFSEIMNAYRKWAKDEARQIKETPVQKIYTDEEILNQRRGELETAFQAMKKGNLVILHTYFSEVLIQDGLMSEEEKIEDFLVRSLATTQNLYTK